MKEPEVFENFPLWSVILINIVLLSLHLAGLYLTYLVTPALALAFLVFILYLEASVYREGCRHCYYYGRLCAFGRGKMAKYLVKRGDPRKFCGRTVTTKDFVLPFMPTIVTVAAGAYLLLQGFDWLILGIAVWPVIVGTFGNQLIYGGWACIHCKQARKCCPASDYFMKKAGKK